ncbi:MAG: hypothetical protein ABIH87_00810 [bacterium]
MPTDNTQLNLDPAVMEEKRKLLVQAIRNMQREERIAFLHHALKDLRISTVPGDKEFAEQLQLEFLGGLDKADLV